jgi:dienelactone hydrolase
MTTLSMKTLANAAVLAILASAVEAGEPVTYTVMGETFEGYLETADGARGTIVQFPTTRGVSGHEIGNAERFAAEGWNSFVADVHGQGKLPTSVEERDASRDALFKDDEQRMAIMRAAIKQAEALGGGDIIVIGFSMGGGFAAEVAWSGLGTELSVDGYGIFSGRVGDRKGRMMPDDTAPIFVARGSADSRIAVTDIAIFEDDADMADVTYRIELYDGKDHMFHAAMSPNYDEAAAGHAWASFYEFLADLPGGNG